MILPDQSCILVTGGAGFIGSAVIRHLIEKNFKKIVNVDALTYAGNLSTLSDQSQYDGYVFEQVNICDQDALREVIKRHQPDAIMHLAAESHVDRSIDGPGLFIETNVKGTYNLLELVREESASQESGRRQIRFHHISTDEVYGSLAEQGLFVEDSPYQPNSPYSASKAASDHLVRAWGETFGVDIVVSNCSNNYGPFQYPEKLIPVVIHRALDEEPIPVYGKGDNVRDWLFVDDHARALVTVMQSGKNGRTYNIGGDSERTNLEVVHGICNVLDQIRPREQGSYSSLIEFVIDRPGHDFRYAIDATRIKTELGWSAKETFESGLRETVSWYLNNQEWVVSVGGDGASSLRRGLGAGR
ncbi:MAG: dTDP-glucose 4,6-dehydratase [Proteobacteria bacterium]|nr:dTDP-glucose 4,6-dehydratase [Pseudomonadota bacterium]